MSNEPDKVNSGALAMTIVLVAFATLGVAAVVTALVRDEVKSQRAVKDVAQENNYRALRAAQQSKNTAGAAWKDKNAGLASIPVKSAEALVLEAVRANPLALSPGNKPKEEEEEEEETEETVDEEAAEGEEKTDGEEAAESEEAAKDEKAPEAPEPKKAPAAPAPAPTPAPAPAPGAPAQ